MKLPKYKNDLYPSNRKKIFKKIEKISEKDTYFSAKDCLLLGGDSLNLLTKIADESIDLILTDPPYHTTKKNNIFGDTSFDTDDKFIDWMNKFFNQWKRVLKPNGSIYMFCSSDMSPYLYIEMSKFFNMHNIIGWSKKNEPGYDGWKQKMNKKSLRRWYPHSEHIIFCSQSVEGNLKKSPFGIFLKQLREETGLSSKSLTELTGAYGKINNGGAVSNWETGRNIPSREQYHKICKAFLSTKKINMMPCYEDVIRPFNIDPKLQFIDIWENMNVRQRKDKHPAEKPLDLLEQIVLTSSYEDDIVLDCFSGSASTLHASIKNKRKAIGIEIEESWLELSSERLANVLTDKVKNKKKLNRKNIQKTLPF